MSNRFVCVCVTTSEVYKSMLRLSSYHSVQTYYHYVHKRELFCNYPTAVESCMFTAHQKTLIYNPAKRISAKSALKHSYFDDLDKTTLPAAENV